MEMASKQFFPFIEMVMQPCLTVCVTVSYGLCNCVLRFMEMAGKQFFPFMEMVMQPCLTVCVTVSYGLWK
jgi:nitrate reductase NapE component